MTISWFRSDEKLCVKEAVKVLYPKTRHFDRHPNLEERSRFTQLILEHGEQRLQDWAVIANSSPAEHTDPSVSSLSSRPSRTQWAQSPSNKSRKNFRTQKKVHTKIDKESYPSVHMTKIEGRLHLCSRSIVFEPSDYSRGILRCPFKKMETAPKEYPSDTQGSTGRFEAMCVELHAHHHVVMKENNIVGPFYQVPVLALFRFTFLHSSPAPFVELCQRLFMLYETSGKNSSSHSFPELDELLKPMLDRPFDISNLVDVRERPVSSTLRCSFLTPLQRRQGCVVITMERIYFQPASGVIAPIDTKAINWLLRDVVAVACRYNGLRDTALEIYWRDSTSILLAFERKRDREQVLKFLPKNIVCFTDREFVVETVKEWQKGTISNFEYLLALNIASGRTFHDLSRYPVFPWVIADFASSKLDLTNKKTFRDLSKPVGALNEKRLKYFRARLEGMQDMDHSFLYGTHYSAPGYVLYYLIRSMPEHMLCLQNGKFDAPDRMFYSIAHCFNCALTNHADVKELIPEFYNSSNDFDFLINARGLQLGVTQIGDRVDDVKLPPWAKSPRDFLKKNRHAMESDYCTAALPKWIDLIFGFKSRGEAAMDASNLFHPCSYLSTADLATMQSELQRTQAELQATEFGIVPDLLFCGPHPLRHSTVDENFISTEVGRSSSSDFGANDAWELLDPPKSTVVNGIVQHNEDSSSDVGLFATLQSKATSQTDVRYATSEAPAIRDNLREPEDTDHDKLAHPKLLSSLPYSGYGDNLDRYSQGSGAFSSLHSETSRSTPMARTRHEETNTVHSKSSAWDITFLEKKQIHGDAVSGCVLFLEEEKPVLATTSLDGGLMVHAISLNNSNDDQSRRGFTGTLSRFSYMAMSRGQITPSSQSKLVEFRSHTSRDPLACLALVSDGVGGKVAFAGGHDDVVLAYGINSGCAVASIYSHRDAVIGLDIIMRSPSVADCSLWLENSTHMMVSGSWDATVKVWSVTVARGETVSVNREPLAELFDADSSIVCVSAIALEKGGVAICAGCADGSFCVWNLHGDGVKVVIHNESARRGSGPCSVVTWSAENGQKHLFTGFSTGMVASYNLAEGRLRKESVVSLGVAVNCLVYSEGILLAGCADGGLRLICVQNGTQFDLKPTLWKSVNNKSAPGICSISITYSVHANPSLGRCICCTGAEDGSVALFELKKDLSNGL